MPPGRIDFSKLWRPSVASVLDYFSFQLMHSSYLVILTLGHRWGYCSSGGMPRMRIQPSQFRVLLNTPDLGRWRHTLLLENGGLI
jgi:hypothetical protein